MTRPRLLSVLLTVTSVLILALIAVLFWQPRLLSLLLLAGLLAGLNVVFLAESLDLGPFLRGTLRLAGVGLLVVLLVLLLGRLAT